MDRPATRRQRSAPPGEHPRFYTPPFFSLSSELLARYQQADRQPGAAPFFWSGPRPSAGRLEQSGPTRATHGPLAREPKNVSEVREASLSSSRWFASHRAAAGVLVGPRGCGCGTSQGAESDASRGCDDGSGRWVVFGDEAANFAERGVEDGGVRLGPGIALAGPLQLAVELFVTLS